MEDAELILDLFDPPTHVLGGIWLVLVKWKGLVEGRLLGWLPESDLFRWPRLLVSTRSHWLALFV